VKVFIHRVAHQLKRAGKLTLIGATSWVALVTMTSTVGIAALLLQSHSNQLTQSNYASTPPATDDWGYEAIEIVKTHAQQFSPVPLANACGLGASSCFRCHNGKRAALPTTAADVAPWHHQHTSVNYSCTGCHQGNPRILKQEIAHKNLVVNPLSVPEKTCGTCHSPAEVDALANTWREISPRLFEHLEKGNY
jgi:hypothetical protein